MISDLYLQVVRVNQLCSLNNLTCICTWDVFYTYVRGNGGNKYDNGTEFAVRTFNEKRFEL